MELRKFDCGELGADDAKSDGGPYDCMDHLFGLVGFGTVIAVLESIAAASELCLL
jgi:hypothetical protein